MNPPLRTRYVWDHEASIRRYRRLLETRLTEIERRFVERRLAEEQLACREAVEIDQGSRGHRVSQQSDLWKNASCLQGGGFEER